MPNRAPHPSTFGSDQRRNSETAVFPIPMFPFSPQLSVPLTPTQASSQSTGPYLEDESGDHKIHASQYILYNYLTRGEKVEYSNEQVSQSQPGKKNCLSVREIPTWKIYYMDQRARDGLVRFTIPHAEIAPNDYLNKKVSLCYNDVCIQSLEVDAVVNCTTENYESDTTHGVSKCIHAEAGNSLRDACQSLPRLEVGGVEITQGFKLPAKYIIHTNGPCPYRDEDVVKLQLCYENSLKMLLRYQLRTIAFPCISTGRKGMNREAAANIALKTVRCFLEANSDKIDRVVFSLHNMTDIIIYRRFMQVYFPIDGGG